MTEENNGLNWFQDNLRIIISVAIVILLVFAIYSYSKRNSQTDVVIDDTKIEEVAMTAPNDNSQEINEIIDEIKDEEAQAKEDTKKQVEEEIIIAKEATEEAAAKKAEAIETAKIQKEAEEAAKKSEQEKKAKQEAEEAVKEQKVSEKADTQDQKKAKDVIREVIESHSKQKEGVVVVVAVHGDSMTTLARKAAANYITKNNIGGLTPAHKIYIEDYMRKAQTSKSIVPGTEIEFSNDLINDAIESSRTLTDAQLQNLDKYAQMVSGL